MTHGRERDEGVGIKPQSSENSPATAGSGRAIPLWPCSSCWARGLQEPFTGSPAPGVQIDSQKLPVPVAVPNQLSLSGRQHLPASPKALEGFSQPLGPLEVQLSTLDPLRETTNGTPKKNFKKVLYSLPFKAEESLHKA